MHVSRKGETAPGVVVWNILTVVLYPMDRRTFMSELAFATMRPMRPHRKPANVGAEISSMQQ